MDAEFEAWDVPEDVREQIAGPREGRYFDVWEENWPAVMLFCATATQWRLLPDGQIMGLDYNAADVAARRLGLEIGPADWQNLMIMEREVLKARNDG